MRMLVKLRNYGKVCYRILLWLEIESKIFVSSSVKCSSIFLFNIVEGKELKGSSTDLSLPKVRESSESIGTTLSNKKRPAKTKVCILFLIIQDYN